VRLLLKRLSGENQKAIKKPNNGIPIIGPMEIPNEGIIFRGQFYKGRKNGWGKCFNTKTGS
jgi:hypothetical protein